MRKEIEKKEKRPGGCTGKGFVKGDPRINRGGRPSEFNALRELAKNIANEPVHGKSYTRVEYILRSWAKNRNWQCQKAFLEIAYGKVPDKIDVGNNLIDISIYADRLLNADSQ